MKPSPIAHGNEAGQASMSFAPAAASFIAAAVADGLAIQDRFKAEPVYARTGVGHLAPSGVAEISTAKRRSA